MVSKESHQISRSIGERSRCCGREGVRAHDAEAVTISIYD